MAVLIQRAQILVQQGRFKDAFTHLRRHLSVYTQDTDGLFLLSVCYLETGNPIAAAQVAANTLSFAPHEDRFLYLQARIAFMQNQFMEAIKNIRGAVALHPHCAHYFGWWGQILLHKKDYEAALEKINEGLAVDPEDEACLNLRSHALFNLGKKEEAFLYLHEALAHNPENAYTHANLGWKWLEAGNQQKALQHFRESLKINPNNNWARNGMIHAIKAKYWIYRQFLNYAFFINRQKNSTQWIIIIAIFMLTQIASRLFFPLYVLMVLVAIFTWLITPVSNLFLRLHNYGRYALSPEQTLVSTIVGVGLIITILAAVAFWITNIPGLLAMCICSGVWLLPAAGILMPEDKKNKKILKWGTAVLSVLAVLGVGYAFITNNAFNIFVTVMLTGTLFYQFLANYIIMKES